MVEKEECWVAIRKSVASSEKKRYVLCVLRDVEKNIQGVMYHQRTQWIWQWGTAPLMDPLNVLVIHEWVMQMSCAPQLTSASCAASGY